MRMCVWLRGGVFAPVCLFYSQLALPCGGAPQVALVPMMNALANCQRGRRSFGLLAQGILVDVMGRIHFAQPWGGNFVIKTVAVFACLFGLILGIICAVQSNIIR